MNRFIYNSTKKVFSRIRTLFYITLISIGYTSDKFGGDVILEHVINDTDKVLHPINFLGIDLSISKHVIMLWIVGFITILLSLYATKIYRSPNFKVPLLWKIPKIGRKFFIYNSKSKWNGIFEILMEFIKSDIVIPNIGKDKYKSWTPLIATFFIFILVGNFIGMIPFFEKIPVVYGSSTITGNMGVTAALSAITFFSIIIAGTLKHGFIGHWKNMIPGGVPAPVLLILIPIEILGMFIKPIALMLRLGANMTAGHIALVAIFGIPMILYGGGYSEGISLSTGIISVILNTAIYFLEMIVCMVQAYVFSLLSAVFIGMAIHAEH